MPIGFSFYVLQVISYLTDVYRRQIQAEKDFIQFALYQAYFPKMLAGPIERAKNFLPQLKHERTVDRDALEQGFYEILLGLLRKPVIANTCQIYCQRKSFPHRRTLHLLNGRSGCWLLPSFSTTILQATHPLSEALVCCRISFYLFFSPSCWTGRNNTTAIRLSPGNGPWRDNPGAWQWRSLYWCSSAAPAWIFHALSMSFSNPGFLIFHNKDDFPLDSRSPTPYNGNENRTGNREEPL